MTLHRQGRRIEFECDTCADIGRPEATHWSEAIQWLRANGWTVFPVTSQAALGGMEVWRHKCPKCRFNGARA
jgi:hypothetical protein